MMSNTAESFDILDNWIFRYFSKIVLFM